MSKENRKIAILVDGDNAQAKILDKILEEVSKYGKVTIRRIYGDWTTPHMNSWKDLLNNLSFKPIQKFSYTKGKNSTDGSMIIDAMDILHDEMVDGFCIVSSDSDYTGLAKRIREEGIFVMGVGEKKTPDAFVQSCEIFTFCETLMPFEEVNKQKTTSSRKGKTPRKDLKVLAQTELKLIDRAFDMSVDEEVEAYVSTVGGNLRKLNPSFDTRNYGFRNLTELFKSLEAFEIINNKVNGFYQPLIKRKN